jgi:DNA-binding transcriptional LysR family regulator
MRLELVETYTAVRRAGTTQGAAALLGLSQSAVSRRLAQLEESLGLHLFRRERSRLVPTRESEALQGLISAFQASGRRLAAQAEALSTGNSAAMTLSVAFPGSLGLTIVPRILSEFLAENDRVRIEVQSGPYDTIERMLLDGRAEVGFLRVPVGRTGLATTPLISSPTVCVMPTGHPLSALAEVSVEDLRRVPMILLGRMRAPRRELDAVLWKHGVEPLVRIEAHSVSSACGLVAAGLGVALVNELMARDYAHMPVEIRPLVQSVPHSFAFATAADTPVSTAAENFIRTATGVLARV